VKSPSLWGEERVSTLILTNNKRRPLQKIAYIMYLLRNRV
jgi:hypothetical protein